MYKKTTSTTSTICILTFVLVFLCSCGDDVKNGGIEDGAIKITQPLNISNNNEQYGLGDQQGDWIYCPATFYTASSSVNGITKMSSDGKKRTALIKFKEDEYLEKLNVVGEWIYYPLTTIMSENEEMDDETDSSTLDKSEDTATDEYPKDVIRFYKTKIDGSETVKISDEPITDFVVNENDIYYSCLGKKYSGIYKMDTDGNKDDEIFDRTAFEDPSFKLYGIAIDKLIFGNGEGNRLFSSDLDGSNIVTLGNTKSQYIDAVASDEKHIYYVVNDSDTETALFYRVGSDGTGHKKIKEEKLKEAVIDTINARYGYVYYMDTTDLQKTDNTDILYRFDLNGNNKEVVRKGQFWGLSLLNDALMIIEPGSDTSSDTHFKLIPYSEI